MGIPQARFFLRFKCDIIAFVIDSRVLKPDLTTFESNCRDLGLPFTLQRRAIAEVVLDALDHPTADDIHDRLGDGFKSISRATVFRTLETFANYGLIQRVAHPGSAARFDGRVDRHHHLICENCSKMVDLNDSSLDDLPIKIKSRQGFRISDFSVQLRGICSDCSGK